MLLVQASPSVAGGLELRDVTCDVQVFAWCGGECVETCGNGGEKDSVAPEGRHEAS